MYLWYTKKNDCATYTSIMFITMIKTFIWLPLVGFIGSLCRAGKTKTAAPIGHRGLKKVFSSSAASGYGHDRSPLS